jgi:hypothetical protein
MSRTFAKSRRAFAETPRGFVAGARQTHKGFRIGGKTQWQDMAAAALLAIGRSHANRGALPANAAGIAVYDRFKPSSAM